MKTIAVRLILQNTLILSYEIVLKLITPIVNQDFTAIENFPLPCLHDKEARLVLANI